MVGYTVLDYRLVGIDPDDTLANPTDATWLIERQQLISLPPHTPMIPLSACSISMPLSLSGWFHFLRSHPNQGLVHLFLKGISEGFRLGYDYKELHLRPAKKNLMEAVTHPNVVDEYLQNEVSLGRVVGPFSTKALPEVHISRFGVIPNNHQPDKWRLIVDLSYPSGHSENDGIPKQLCGLKYITVDDSINHILKLRHGTHLAKTDIKNAFRLLPVHPADRHLLGMHWRDGLFIDTCLPFELRSVPRLFNILVDFMAWILQ